MDGKPEIKYDDFAKLDIRIGTIVAAELVPDTDKLIKCTVDLGLNRLRQAQTVRPTIRLRLMVQASGTFAPSYQASQSLERRRCSSGSSARTS